MLIKYLITRWQAMIRMKEGGLFYLENHNKHPIVVKSRVIASEKQIHLGSNHLIEIDGMIFICEMYKRLTTKQVEPILRAKFIG